GVAVEEGGGEGPGEVGDIVRKLMAKRPENRYQAPIEVVAALARITAVEAAPSIRSARPKSDPSRPGHIPTPLQETIVPSSSDDTDEGPIIRVEPPRDRKSQIIQIANASVAVAGLTTLPLILLPLE